MTSIIKGISWRKKDYPGETELVATFSTNHLDVLNQVHVFKEVARLVAERYVKENYNTIAEQIKPSEITAAVTEEVAKSVLSRMLGDEK